MDFWTYIRDKIQFANGNWKGIHDQYTSENPIVSIDASNFDDIFKKISKDDYNTIPKSEKRFVFRQNPRSITSQSISECITIIGSIKMMTESMPYHSSITYICKKCGLKRTYASEIPILSISKPENYICESNTCKFSDQDLDTAEYFVDCVELQIATENRTIQGFISNKIVQGFENVIGKTAHAYASQSLVQFHGILRIGQMYGRNAYFLEIMDIDILQPMSKSNKLIPFIISNRPATEKEMVMGIFFSNLEFFKSYLSFTSYELRKAYPDIIVYDGKNIRNMEFEFDAANFYTHGHHTSDVKCDLIIAWVNTSRRSDIPVLLLPDLQNRYIPEDVHTYISKYDPNEILAVIYDTLQFCFKDRAKESIMPLVFPIIMTRAYAEIYPISIAFLINGNDDDSNAWKLVHKIFPNASSKMCVITDEKKKPKDYILIKIAPSDGLNAAENPMDRIGDAKNYLYLLRNMHSTSPAPIQGKSVYANAYSYTHDIEKSNVLVALASILSSFALNNNVIDEDVANAWEIMKNVL